MPEDNEELNALMTQAAEEGADLADDEVEIDLSEAVTYEPFTASKVPVEIVTAKLGQGPKARYIELKVRIFDGEHEGRVIFTNATLTGKGASFGFEILQAFGATSADGTPIGKENPKISVSRLEGLRALADIAPDKNPEYANKVRIGKVRTYVSAATEEAANLK